MTDPQAQRHESAARPHTTVTTVEVARADGNGKTHYSERMTAPWWLWLSALVMAAVLAAEIGLGVPGMRTWLPYLLVLPPILGLMWWLGRIRLSVTDEELRVDDARLPRAVVADVVVLDATGRRELLGPFADPLAFVIQRPWINGAVQVLLDDPADPTPYWLISTRNPGRLAAVLLQEPDQPGDGRRPDAR